MNERHWKGSLNHMNAFSYRDTAGQERFAPIGSMYYHGAKAVIFTYDITQVALLISAVKQ